MKERIAYFDGLRVVACLMVITIHVFGFIAGHYAPLSTSTKVLDAVVVSFSRAGVSLFFMISGALMLENNKNESISYIFKHRFLRLLKLILLASTLYLIGSLLYDHRQFSSFKEVLNGYTNNGFTHAMWFLYMLAGLYLCVPLLVALKNKSEKYLVYLVVLVFFNVYMREFFAYLFNIEFIMEIPMATAFLGVFILGYLLNKAELSERVIVGLTILWRISLLIMIVVTYTKSMERNELDDGLWENYNLLTLFMSTGFFVFVKNSQSFKHFSQKQIVRCLANFTLGVYLLHVFILNCLLKIAFAWDISKMHTKNFVVLWLLTTIISFLGVFLGEKIKIMIKDWRTSN